MKAQRQLLQVLGISFLLLAASVILLQQPAWGAGQRQANRQATDTPAETPTNTPEPTATPWIVTATPVPTDVFAAATAKAERQRRAETTGTPTATPENMVLATATVTPRAATLTPTPENAATATLHALQATAIAFTTGTPYFVTPRPTNTPLATPTILVTPTPRPLDVFAAATRKVEQATLVAAEGTPTPLPRYFEVATASPTPRVVTATATPGNEATAVYHALQATAIAFTTGMPPVITATPTELPGPTATRMPPTATPLFVYLAAMTPTPGSPPAFPQELVGKIVFQAAFPNPRATAFMVMDPDGANAAVLSGRLFYDQAELRDATTAGGNYAYAEQERGPNQGGLTQIWVYDKASDSRSTWTHFGAGTAWWPAWSPDGSRLAFTANEPGNDELFVMAKDQWPATRLTSNDWEWDHHPTWSPDGSQILFSSNRSGMRQLWIMNADGSNPRQLTNFPFEVWNPVWVKGAAQAPASAAAPAEPEPNPGK